MVKITYIPFLLFRVFRMDKVRIDTVVYFVDISPWRDIYIRARFHMFGRNLYMHNLFPSFECVSPTLWCRPAFYRIAWCQKFLTNYLTIWYQWRARDGSQFRRRQIPFCCQIEVWGFPRVYPFAEFHLFRFFAAFFSPWVLSRLSIFLPNTKKINDYKYNFLSTFLINCIRCVSRISVSSGQYSSSISFFRFVILQLYHSMNFVLRISFYKIIYYI